MKKIFILALSVLLYSCQETKEEVAEEATEIADVVTKMAPPEAVAVAFASSFPDVKDVGWEKEGDMYEASFTTDGNETSVIYTADGSHYATETEIATGDLPPAVQNAASTNGNITEACKIILTGGAMQYEVEAGDKDYVYDDKGNLVATEEDDEDEGNDD